MTLKRLALAIWVLILIACVMVIGQTRFVADLSAFLPQTPNARQQMLVDQLRDGIIARLIMVGVEGADPTERARLSRGLAARLSGSPAFVGVQNGATEVLARDQAYFFDNRYLLSPAITPQRFSAEGLQQAITESLASLSGNSGMLLKRLLPRDPTAETLNLLENFSGTSQPRSLEGVWASRDGQRALLLIQTRAAGSDIDGQAAAMDEIRKAFAAQQPKAGAQLLMTGAGVFSVSSRHTIETEVSRFALAGILLVVSLLLLVYRSVRLLALGLLPVLSGALVGVAAVSLGFGQVHGLTLGFGTTLIGEAVDYSIYLFIQRANGAPQRSFWRIIGLGVLTSLAGFAALLCSGFPGLAQLGLYSISGLLAAALVTRFVLPWLMPAQLHLRDLSGVSRVLLGWAGQAWRLRLPMLILVLAAAGWLWFARNMVWNHQLNALSPVSWADQQLDHQLRGDMGAPEMRYIVALTAPDRETALADAEKLDGVLRQLVATKLIGGFTSPTFALPGAAVQKARQAAMPDAITLRRNLEQALRALPIRAERLTGFIDDVQAARVHPLLTRADLDGTSASMLVDSLLIQRAKDYLVLLPLRPPGDDSQDKGIDVARIEAALARSEVAGATVLDLVAETTDLYAGYLHDAIVMAAWGGLAIIVLLLICTRSLVRTWRVTVPLLCAILCVAAALSLGGRQLTILHLVGLLLVAAVGSNYALFFDGSGREVSSEQRGRTLVSLVLANFTAVVSFGLLGFSQVPVLSAIGSTVGPGALLALIFSAILARKVESHGYQG
jgi:predicted exporter